MKGFTVSTGHMYELSVMMLSQLYFIVLRSVLKIISDFLFQETLSALILHVCDMVCIVILLHV